MSVSYDSDSLVSNLSVDVFHDDTFISQIINDIWIDIFHYLQLNDFTSVRATCKHFNDLTNPKLHVRINQFWYTYCCKLCKNVSFPTCDETFAETGVNFHSLFVQLLGFLCIEFQFVPKGNRFTYNHDDRIFIGDSKNINFDFFTQTIRIPCVVDSKDCSFIFVTDPILIVIEKDNLPLFQAFTCNIISNDNPDDDEKDNKTYDWSRCTINDNRIHRGSIVKRMHVLYAACFYGANNIIEWLLSDKCRFKNVLDINEQTKYGITPLMYCCQMGYTQVVKKLLNHSNMMGKKAGVEKINMTESDGNTALNIACREGRTDIVRLLLNYDKTDVNAANDYGYTPLMTTIKCEQLDVFKVIIEFVKRAQNKQLQLQAHRKVDVNYSATCGNDETALIMTTKQISVTSLTMMKMLLQTFKNEIDTQKVTSLNKKTAMQIAQQRRKNEKIKLLANYSAS